MISSHKNISDNADTIVPLYTRSISSPSSWHFIQTTGHVVRKPPSLKYRNKPNHNESGWDNGIGGVCPDTKSIGPSDCGSRQNSFKLVISNCFFLAKNVTTW
jgi:hypothetical protein